MIELVVCDLEEQALAHLPSGRFGADAAWPWQQDFVEALGRIRAFPVA